MDSDVEEAETEQRAFLTFTREYAQPESAPELAVHSQQPHRPTFTAQRNNSSVESASTSTPNQRGTSGASSRAQLLHSRPFETDQKQPAAIQAAAATSRVLDRVARERPRVLVEDLLVSFHCTMSHSLIRSFIHALHESSFLLF